MSDYTKSKNRRMILSSMAAVVFCAAIGLNACTMPAKSDQETPAQVQEAKDPAGEQAEPTDAHHDSLDTHDDYTSMQEGDPHDSQENKNEQDGAENRILPLVKPDRFYYYNGHTYGILHGTIRSLYGAISRSAAIRPERKADIWSWILKGTISQKQVKTMITMLHSTHF